MGTKIMLLNFGNSDCREYNGTTGKLYTFYKGRFVDIEDPRDALMFLKAGNGTLFKSESSMDKVIKLLEVAVKKLIKSEDKVDEDNPPVETGVLEPNADDLAVDGADAVPVDGDDEVINVYTPEGIKALNKAEQTFLIQSFTTNKVPKLEADRIKLLLKLQDDGNDLLTKIKEYKA